eukprot:s1597_g19.t1
MFSPPDDNNLWQAAVAFVAALTWARSNREDSAITQFARKKLFVRHAPAQIDRALAQHWHSIGRGSSMPPQAVASDATKRIKELLDEKAALEQTINELKAQWNRISYRRLLMIELAVTWLSLHAGQGCCSRVQLALSLIQHDIWSDWCRHERERESQNKARLFGSWENLEQLKLIDKREEALKRKEEILNKAKSELEAEAADGREKRQQLGEPSETLVAFRKQKATHCEVSQLEVARMEAEDFRQLLAQARYALQQSQESQQRIQLRANDLEKQLSEANQRIAKQNLQQRISLRDLHTSWCVAALAQEELRLGPAQQETIKACSEALTANAAAVSSEGRHGKRRKAAYSATQESVLKLKAELMSGDFSTQRLVELTCEALLRVHCQRAKAADDVGGFRLEELAKQLHAAERALLRSHKTKPVMPLLSSVAVVCLIASGGARRSRARLEELYKGVKAVSQQLADLHETQCTGCVLRTENLLYSVQRLDNLLGKDGLITGLWCVCEESVEDWRRLFDIAWDLIENFQQRCRRFLVHSKGEGGSRLRLLLYWLFVDSRQVLDAKRAEDKQPWVELASLLRP